MALPLPTPEELQGMRHLTTSWRMTPPCFEPNERCQNLVDRGWVEIGRYENGRYGLRLTPAGDVVMSCEGTA